MKKTVSLFQKLIRLTEGEALPSSQLRGEWVEEMLVDGILQKQAHGRHLCYTAHDAAALTTYLRNRWDISGLHTSVRLLQDKEAAPRAFVTHATGDS